MDKEKTDIKRISAPMEFTLFLWTITVLGIALILPGMIGGFKTAAPNGEDRYESKISLPSVVEEPQAAKNEQAYTVVLNIPAVEMGWQPPLSEYMLETISFDPWSKSDGDGVLAKQAEPVGNAATHQKKPPFHGIINEVAGRYEVDPHLIRAIIFAESGFNPKARSKKGARGLMQLMPATAKALGVQNVDDPEENIDGGVRYFKSLLDRFDGDVKLALAAYNAGSRHVRNYEGVPPFKATRIYIKKVLTFHKKFKAEMGSISRKMV